MPITPYDRSPIWKFAQMFADGHIDAIRRHPKLFEHRPLGAELLFVSRTARTANACGCHRPPMYVEPPFNEKNIVPFKRDMWEAAFIVLSVIFLI